jgi:hypothetical protein
MKRQGRFAKTKIAKARDRAPLVIVLTDGTHCQIRDGGAWGQLKGHPNLYGAYSCTRHGAVWARMSGSRSAAHWGVNESDPSWTVRTAGFRAHHTVLRHVARAYFVSTAS